MLKPEVGDYYQLFKDRGLDYGNIIKILRIEGNAAFYTTLNRSLGEFRSPWNFVKYPHGVDRKLTPLEVELL
jgi:hypothetical protein